MSSVSPAHPLLHEGQTIRGTYEVERFLGQGAFAEVYRVKHRFLGRQAMKVFKTVGITGEETEQMLGEAILLSGIGHPNIVRVFDANVTETSRGTCGFFTMEYVAGGSLEQFWRSHGSQLMPVETAVAILQQVCRGLAVAHAEKPPIVHRDIKPQNILVGYDATGLRALVSDFGLAKRVNPLTLLVTTMGTRTFKAPEALKDFKTDSCAGDVWALGCTLYLLLSDRLPYSDMGDADSRDSKQFDRPLIPPSRLNLQVDHALDQILFRMLALKADERYATAKELLDDLTKWKPRAPKTAGTTKTVSTEASKSALGAHSPVDPKQGEEMAAAAVALVRHKGHFTAAADLMEEAFNKWPDLRERYEYKVKLWRRGIAM